MKNKSLSLCFLALLTLMFSLLAVSAAIEVPSSLEFSRITNTQNLVIRNTNLTSSVIVTLTNAVLQDSKGNILTFTPNVSTITIANGSSANVNVSYAGDASKFSIGTHSVSMNVSDGVTTKPINLVLKRDLCSVENKGELEVEVTEMEVAEGFGDEDDFWYPLDEIEVTFDVTNTGDYDISNIEITACLLDTKTKECIMDEGDMDLSDDDFDLDADDDITVTMNFKLDPDNLEAGNTAYELHVAARGEIDDRSSPYNEQDTCYSTLESAKIITDEEFVILDEITFPEPVVCNQPFEITATVWNIGDKDLDKDEVFIYVYNTQLGIKESIELEDDLDAMDSQEITIPLSITKSVENQFYELTFEIYNDDSLSDNDIYEAEEADEEARFTAEMQVSSCAASKNASIAAQFSAETPSAIIGDKVIIDATIKNTGTTQTTYNLGLSGDTTWFSSSTIEPKTFTLAPGESKTVSITLQINDNEKEETKEFSIQASYDGKISEQKIKIVLEKGISSGKILNSLKENWLIYVIVLVNILLIIAIIVVVIRIARRASKD